MNELLPDLQRGGYVFYFRHALTRMDDDRQLPIDRKDCATQRNLSPEGRQQAAMLGEVIRRLGVPIGRTLSSPFCRCVDTAKLAFSTPEISEDLYFVMGLSKAEREAKAVALRHLLAETPAHGTNTFIVAHTANLDEAVGLWPKPEGVAILFRPDRSGGFEPIGRIPPEAWASTGQAGH